MRTLRTKIHIALASSTEVEKAKGSLAEASYGKSCPTKNLSLAVLSSSLLFQDHIDPV